MLIPTEATAHAHAVLPPTADVQVGFSAGPLSPATDYGITSPSATAIPGIGGNALTPLNI